MPYKAFALFFAIYTISFIGVVTSQTRVDFEGKEDCEEVVLSCPDNKVLRGIKNGETFSRNTSEAMCTNLTRGEFGSRTSVRFRGIDSGLMFDECKAGNMSMAAVRYVLYIKENQIAYMESHCKTVVNVQTRDGDELVEDCGVGGFARAVHITSTGDGNDSVLLKCLQYT